jgi:outer membrane autotransporter protein
LVLLVAGGRAASAQTVVGVDCPAAFTPVFENIGHFPSPNPTANPTPPPTTLSGSSTCHITATLTVPSALIGYFSNASVLAALIRTGLATNQQALTTTTELSIGPATILIGRNQSVTAFFPAGTTNLNTNVHTENFPEVVIASSANAATSALFGDVHASFQTTLLDDGFHFLDSLLGRGRGETNGAASLFAPSMSAFAADTVTPSPIDAALAYASKVPRGAMPRTAAMGGGWSAWIKGSLDRYAFAGSASNYGVSSRGVGVDFGIERRIGPWLIGGAVGFGDAKVTQDVTGDKAGIDTVRLGAYASNRSGPWSFTAAMAGGVHSIDTSRLAVLLTPAQASYNAASMSTGLEAARRVPLHDGSVIEPAAGLIYTLLHVNGFTETGTTFLDVAGDSTDVSALKGYVGARTWRAFTTANGTVLTPEIRGRVLYDMLDDPRGYTARFVADPAATPLLVTGLQPGRTAYMLGGAVTARLASAWHASLSYDAEWRSGDTAHHLSGGVKASW